MADKMTLVQAVEALVNCAHEDVYEEDWFHCRNCGATESSDVAMLSLSTVTALRSALDEARGMEPAHRGRCPSCYEYTAGWHAARRQMGVEG